MLLATQVPKVTKYYLLNITFLFAFHYFIRVHPRPFAGRIGSCQSGYLHFASVVV